MDTHSDRMQLSPLGHQMVRRYKNNRLNHEGDHNKLNFLGLAHQHIDQ